MKRIQKNVLYLIVALIILILSYAYFYNRTIQSSLIDENIYSQNENVQKAFQSYKVIKCDFDLLNPKYAFVSFQHYVYPERSINQKIYRVDFYNLHRNHYFDFNWNSERYGGARVDNIDFVQLTKMVGDDCSQFQNTYTSTAENEISWSYKSVLNNQGIENQISLNAQSIRETFVGRFTEEEAKVLKGIFGDWDGLSDEEIIEYDKKFENIRSNLVGDEKEMVEKILLAESERYIEQQRLKIRNKYN